MNNFERELRKIVGRCEYIRNPKYVGRACVGRLDDEIVVKMEFESTMILEKYIDMVNSDSIMIPKKITPHCLRHSKAMHMVEAGINLIYIRDFLGHESVETTQIYAKANPEARRKALKKATPDSPTPALPDWNDNPDLMKFLHSL